jgi:hypothetical protein
VLFTRSHRRRRPFFTLRQRAEGILSSSQSRIWEAGLVRKLQNFLARLVDRAPPPRPDRSDGLDWIPPVLGVGDMSNFYLLAMADREAAWYFERR